MCVLSGVYDHYREMFPSALSPFRQPLIPRQPFPTQIVNIPTVLPSPEIEDLRQLVKDFKEAVKAAKLIDKLMKQPDCEDPEKAKLEERVAALEKELAKLKRAKK